MNPCHIKRILVVSWVAAILLASMCNADTGPELASLEYTTSSPIHSYFEGLRGRYTLWTPAVADDPLALWINAASLGTGKSEGFGYIHTYTNSTFSGDDAFSLSFRRFGLGAEFFDLKDVPTTDRKAGVAGFATRRYTLALGGRIGWNFYLGTSYSWHTSEIRDIDKGSSWSVGALFRPHRTTSMGFAARDLNSPEYYGTKFKPIYETSLAIRPWNERFALYANWLARAEPLEGNLDVHQPTSFLTFGMDYELLHGLVLKLGGDEDQNFSASLSLLLGQGGLGSTYTSVKGKGDQEDTGFGALLITAGTSWRKTVLIPPNKYLEIDLSGRIAEAGLPFRIFGVGGPRHTLGELLTKIDYAKRSREIQAIVLRCGGIAANFAIYDELRQALIDFRNSGKKVLAYVENPGNGVYYLATACDYIVLQPNGYVGLVGLKSEGMFLRGTLDKLGMKAYYARVGKYKSAVEPLTEDEYTDPGKEATDALLDDVFEKMIEDIASGRGFSKTEVAARIDRGPFIPSEAVKEGLVDTLAYWDEVPDIANALAGQSLNRIGYHKFSERKPADRRWDQPPVIGIIYGIGGIMHGTNRRDMWLGEVMGSETIMEAFRAMREDEEVDAVVFRVDSPGGMMTASDKIRREVKLTADRKPVIISMGGVAASGGYHISCDGTVILADDATVTGSIGVLNIWLHTRGFYEKIGANKDIFLRGEHADIFPTWREVTDDDLELAQYYVDRYYDKFVRDVAEGRAMSVSEVNQIAQGRVWSGKRAQELGLVDKIGGFAEAVRLAKREAGIAHDEQVSFRILPEPGGLLENLRQAMGASVANEIDVPKVIRDLVGDAACLRAYDEPILYLMPYRIEIE